MSILQLKSGERGVLKDIQWGESIKRKLYDMGLTPGTVVSVINISGRGPVVLDVRGSRLAIGRGVGEKISIDPLV